MKDALRLFVAAALPHDVQQYLTTQASLFQDEAIRLVPPQNLHLTLFFLGSTPSEELPAILTKIQLTAQQQPPFELTLQCLEPGPKPKSPRLIWARFGQSQAFEQLVRNLTLQLSPQPQKLPKAIPHVTLARFRKGKPVPVIPTPVLPKQTITLHIAAISLWQSELASPHPIYRILQSFSLGHNQK